MKRHLSLKISGVVFFLSISVSAGNAQWIQTNLFNVSSVSSLASIGDHLFAGTRFGLYVTADTGKSWSAVVNTGFPNTTVSSLLISGTNFYAGTDFGVYVSTDSGSNWTLDGISLLGVAIHSVAAIGSNIFAGTPQGVFLFSSKTSDWVQKKSGITDTNVTTLLINGTTIFAGTGANNGGSIFFSNDSGTSWIKTNFPNHVVFSLTTDGTNLYAGTNQGFFLSKDNGTSWTVRNTGLTNINVIAISISESNIFAGTIDSGVFLSTNNGMTWSTVSKGLEDSNIYSLSIFASNLFAGMYDGGGIWRRPITEMTGPSAVSSSASLPFSLEQNSPNPFSTSTTIHFSLLKHERVTITLSNMLGIELRTLLNEDADAGEYVLRISSNNLPTGTYIVSMNADGKIKSEKITVIK